MVGKPPYRLASCSMRSLNAFFAEQPRPLEPRKTSYETIATGSGVAVYIEPLRSGWAGKWRWEGDVYVQKSVFSTGPNSTVMPAIYSRGEKERKSKDEKGGIRTMRIFIQMNTATRSDPQESITCLINDVHEPLKRRATNCLKLENV